MKDVEVITLIRTGLTTRGSGDSTDDPVRVVTQYWDMDGNLVIEYDPFKEEKWGEK